MATCVCSLPPRASTLGDNTGGASWHVTADLLGFPRFVDVPSVPDTGFGTPPLVDMGAYEAQVVVVYLTILMK